LSIDLSKLSPEARYILPSFEERTSYGFKRQDPYNKLFEDRIVFLGVQVDDASADDVMAQLLVLESQDPDRDITMYINSPGGSFTAMTAIYDTMQYIRPHIQTVCLGQAASAAAVLLVNKDIDRDKILTADEALEYGLIDQVLTSRKNPLPAK